MSTDIAQIIRDYWISLQLVRKQKHHRHSTNIAWLVQRKWSDSIFFLIFSVVWTIFTNKILMTSHWMVFGCVVIRNWNMRQLNSEFRSERIRTDVNYYCLFIFFFLNFVSLTLYLAINKLCNCKRNGWIWIGKHVKKDIVFENPQKKSSRTQTNGFHSKRKENEKKKKIFLELKIQ